MSEEDTWKVDNWWIISGIIILCIFVCVACVGCLGLGDAMVKGATGVCRAFANCCTGCCGPRRRVIRTGSSSRDDTSTSKDAKTNRKAFSCRTCLNSALGFLLCGGNCCGTMPKKTTMLRNKTSPAEEAKVLGPATTDSTLPLLSIV